MRQNVKFGLLLIIVFILMVFVWTGFKGTQIFVASKEVQETESNQALNTTIDSTESDQLQVTFLNIPSGEATLIIGSDLYILVDTGAPTAWEALQQLLEKHGIFRLDYLFVTNGDPLFAGNIENIIKNYEVGSIVVSDAAERGIIPEELRNEVNILQVKKGDILSFEKQKAQIEILHPGEQLSLSPQNNSLVFRLMHGKNVFLFTSGINEEAEQVLVELYDLKSQILKVSDGGSIFGSSQAFIEEVDAHIAVLFTYNEEQGKNEVMERLEETWIDVYQTKRNGSITIRSLEDDYQVEKER